VRGELEKRENSRRNWKSMKSEILEEYVRTLPSGEETDALNEWNRRRINKTEGRIQEWDDEKLDRYITNLRADGLIMSENEGTRLQLNMIETRGVRRKSNEQMIQKVSKLEADTEEISQSKSWEVERYEVAMNDDAKREGNHAKVMAELKSSRKIKGELERALKEKHNQERLEKKLLKEQLKNEKIQAKEEQHSMRVEDARSKRERKDDRKKQKDEKANQRKLGSV